MARILPAVFLISMVTLSSFGQTLKVANFDEVEKRMVTNDGQIKVFNFWATWCGPCVKEMPYFEAMNSKNEVDVIFVSLDFPDEQEKVTKFLVKKNIDSEVILLDEKKYENYMDRVSKEWTGAIPATLIISKSGKRHFYEKPFSKEELEREINKYIN